MYYKVHMYAVCNDFKSLDRTNMSYLLGSNPHFNDTMVYDLKPQQMRTSCQFTSLVEHTNICQNYPVTRLPRVLWNLRAMR